MKTEQITLITSITAAADLSTSKNLFIGFDGNLNTSGAKSLGVLNENISIGEQAPVAVSGIALVKSGAAITVGSRVQADASGKAVTLTAGQLSGYTLDAASDADELIRVLLA
jgi:hypothetical protein